jgi:arylsulfatase A-like enzyme
MKPNVLILMTDQLNFKCLGYKGHPTVKTPNLDALKRDSVEFTRCYVQNAFCMPSRTSYMTGQYLFEHRQYGFHGLLGEETPSMPAFFADHGYTTFHVGKAHVHALGELLGFHEFIPTLPEDTPFATNPENSYQAFVQRKGYAYPTDQVHGGDLTPPVRVKKLESAGRHADSIGTSHIPLEDSEESYTSAKAIEFLEAGQPGDQPFFLHVSFDRPHPPLSPSEPFDRYYDENDVPLADGYSEEQIRRMPEHIRKIITNNPNSVAKLGRDNMKKLLTQYYGLITHIDSEIGKIINVLKQRNLYDNTIIMFYSDHGDMAGYNGLTNKFSNQIFHDNIIRTPMLVKLTGQEKAGAECDSLTEAVDVFPTLADLCNLDRSSVPIRGANMLGRLTDTEEDRRRGVAFSESYGIKTIVQGDWKLIYYVNSHEGELYHLASDPDERNNLYTDASYRNEVTALKLEIVNKLTKPVSERRQNWIRSLFDNTEPARYGMMEKLHKWNKNIADGGGFWMVCRAGYRMTYLPFDDEFTLYKEDPAQAVPGQHAGYISSNDDEVRESLLNELLNYLATTIRPISLMSGNQQAWDNMLQTKGPGLC